MSADGCCRSGPSVARGERAPRPAWIPNRGGKQWAVIALLDYGDTPIEFGTRVPLGVNMAFRRDAFVVPVCSIRRPGAKQARCSDRKSASGVSALARPACVASMFPRWWSSTSSRRNGSQKPTSDGGSTGVGSVAHGCISALASTWSRRSGHLRLRDGAAHRRRAPLPVPQSPGSTGGLGNREIRRRPVEAFEHETWLWFFAGILRQRWKDSRVRSVTDGKLQESALHATASRDRVA